MEKSKIRQQMNDIEKRMRIIEWDRERSGVTNKDYILERLQEEHAKLANEFKESS
ncbi:hypothetical protein GF323_04985 [Candidatus Woesearchaeota archaeon]|nr:hypothetical protein [Candidatus Woesearchaeota archaeon]